MWICCHYPPSGTQQRDSNWSYFGNFCGVEWVERLVFKTQHHLANSPNSKPHRLYRKPLSHEPIPCEGGTWFPLEFLLLPCRCIYSPIILDPFSQVAWIQTLDFKGTCVGVSFKASSFPDPWWIQHFWWIPSFPDSSSWIGSIISIWWFPDPSHDPMIPGRQECHHGIPKKICSWSIWSP